MPEQPDFEAISHQLYKSAREVEEIQKKFERMKNSKKFERMKNSREQLAALCHEQWSGWMKYLFSKSFVFAKDSKTEPLGALIPATLAERWKRQMITPYAELSEEEKDSDRAEADKFISLLESL